MQQPTNIKDSGKTYVSRILYEASKKTWENRRGKFGQVFLEFDRFSGIRGLELSLIPLSYIKDCIISSCSDGIGTKVEIAERTSNHKTIAHDLIAMVCDDAAMSFAEPIFVTSVLDANQFNDIKAINQIAQGYINAAKEANVVILNGESAQLGSRVCGYGKFNYNWGASCVWLARKSKILSRKNISQDSYLVALEEPCFRSNGFTTIREILRNNYGENWHEHEFNKKPLGDHALTPSKIYCRAVVDMFGGIEPDLKVDLRGIVHITGGGIPEKLSRVLKQSGLGAFIDSPFVPSKFVYHIQEIGNVSDYQAYKTWNMGAGMILITPQPQKAIEIAGNYKIKSSIIGKIIQEPIIKIKSAGFFNKGKILEYGL